MYYYTKVKELLNKTVVEITSDDNEIYLTTSEGEKYKMFHKQDGSETVWLEDVTGNLNDLLHSPITIAQVILEDGSDDPNWDKSRTWTFCKFATNKGTATMLWCGESNGNYSECVDFVKLKQFNSPSTFTNQQAS